MPAALTDKIKKSGVFTVTTLSAPGKALAASSITVGSTTNFPSDTGIVIGIREVDADGELVAGTYREYSAIVASATTFTITPTPVLGSDRVYTAGSTTQIFLPLSTYADNEFKDAVLVHTDQDGTLKAGAVDTVGVLASGVISTTAPFATALNPVTRDDEMTFDYVASGCVWSGDAYGSTRVASMTSGVVYIDGTRVPVSAVTSRTFTASRDTYIDVGTDGVVDYTEVTNNNASPALSASHIRLGIIVTGASNIANVGSVNQGQFDKVLPIASSIAYTFTDSLGNIICPRDPQRRTLGYKQVTASQNTITTEVDITGLASPVIVPDGSSVELSACTRPSSSALVENMVLRFKESTTQLNQLDCNAAPTAGAGISCAGSTAFTPTSGLHTYKVTFARTTGAGTVNLNASATNPMFIMVKRA